MSELDLLAKLPKPKRDLQERKTAKASNAEAMSIARLFGQQYFDGPREYGYGGYRYDGRWVPVAGDIVKFYNLQSGSRVLDVGCAKGFLVSDFMDYEIDAFGLDISRYALKHCHSTVIGRLHLGEADLLPFPDNSFDLVLSINTLHNLPRDLLIEALKEIRRVSKGNAFIQVDSYRTPEQKQQFEDWVLTAQFHGYPDDWLEVFAEANYRGDYGWTIIE